MWAAEVAIFVYCPYESLLYLARYPVCMGMMLCSEFLQPIALLPSILLVKYFFVDQALEFLEGFCQVVIQSRMFVEDPL